ncbi:dihydrofolate reductase family protein [Rugosimonospora africana]|uniref:Deaminase reductase n=1 Tax=Rugosimonospora africana TaxID=556532 RepID=A0A8J3QRC4_9ACTN|nr:dihydrofolate reductase family protein [Rugosimonospora africana]GIH15479.1 deaminase reductase [Rugosimonospora africana]
MTAQPRKLVVSALTTVDGAHHNPMSFAGPYFDDAAAARSMADLEACDAMLMGRNTYEYFAQGWSNATDPYSRRINDIVKYVFSSTLTTAAWSNTTVLPGDVATTVAELKQQGGGDLMIYGYGRLSQILLEHGLVDKLKIAVFPVIAGAETPLSRPGRNAPLRLASTHTWTNGTVQLAYIPEGGTPR